MLPKAPFVHWCVRLTHSSSCWIPFNQNRQQLSSLWWASPPCISFTPHFWLHIKAWAFAPMLQARLASFLQWSKSSLPFFFLKGGKVFPLSAPWKQNFPLCLCMHVCKVLKYQPLSSVKRRSPSLLHNLLSQVPLEIELFLNVSVWLLCLLPYQAVNASFMR